MIRKEIDSGKKGAREGERGSVTRQADECQCACVLSRPSAGLHAGARA